MEGAIDRSRRLVGLALRVVLGDRTLVAMVAAGMVLLAATLAATFLAVHPFHGPGHWLLWSLVSAFPASFVVTFFNVALAAAADAALRGERLPVRGALAVPVRRIGRVAAWSLVTAGVGRLIAAVSRWVPVAPWLTQLVLGAAWSLLTLFAIPVIALEERTALDGARRSLALVRERWREGAAGYAGISLVAVFPLLAIPFLLVASLPLSLMWHPALWICVGAMGLLALVSLGVAIATENVFTVALYRYAASGEALVFSEADLRTGVGHRKRF
jgi:Family of unknown function (DUF6159)